MDNQPEEGERTCVDCGVTGERYATPKTPSGCVEAGGSLTAYLTSQSGFSATGQSSRFGLLLKNLIGPDENGDGAHDYKITLTYDVCNHGDGTHADPAPACRRHTVEGVEVEIEHTTITKTLTFTAEHTSELIAKACTDCAIEKVAFDNDITWCLSLPNFCEVPCIHGQTHSLIKAELEDLGVHEP
jgi:hypothetical protein